MQKTLRRTSTRPSYAQVFAALGDETRLTLVARLSRGQPNSISQLTEGSRLTRQAITKHLRVLQGARIVRSVRAGRESRFAFDPEAISEVRNYLDFVSEQWDQALGRLKSLVER
ncbi:MAG TPA: metalloregulator ArsR/SmtB family transcription factor [Candidatus Acidoferrum sp.]|nr:metalloregulator ArsR/SmtB family transcription factor [Candidatus Acidoferrum sp.]